MQLSRAGIVLLALLFASLGGPALAQTTSSIAGTVVDQDGGAVPGATVAAKNVATGVSFTAFSGPQGGFSIPAVPGGTYTVTVSLDGFKTAIYDDVVVTVGGPGNVRAVLEVGNVSETVNVQATGAIVQTQSTTISSTINTTEIQNLPLTSRSVLDFVVNLPGVSTPGGNRNSTINGLQQSSINITLDGINVQDNTLKTTDGFFAIVNPRLDAIEEVTVSSAAQTADSAGTGAVQIKFVTKSGSNAYSGSLYHYYRNDALNENDYFNIRDGVAKPDLLQNQPGGRLGGPVVIPGLFDGHNRAFFFVNYEEFRQPRQLTRDRQILTPDAQAGIFKYFAGDDLRQVNLYELAAANGIPASGDPIITQLLADIRASTNGTGAITDLSDPNVQRFSFNVDARSHNRYPTVRLDVNLSERHRLSGSLNYQKYLSVPDTLNNRDPRFPGFPVTGTQQSTRIGVSTSLRSTLSANVVNELRVGGSGAPVRFFPEINPSMWSTSFANQGGFNLDIDTANIDNPANSESKSSRNAYTWLVENTVNWQKGSHGINFGGSVSEVYIWSRGQNVVPELDFDVITGTAGDAVFASSGNFPGASSGERNDAEDLYAVLAGSISGVDGDARIDGGTGEYVYLGESLQEGRLRDFAFWFQDAWRPRPDLTINLGLRYEFQTPFQALNDSYSGTTLDDVWGISGFAPGCDASSVTPETCNIFRPGFTPGKAVTEYYLFEQGNNLFNMDWDNLAPSVGVAWTPSTEDSSGFVGRFLGQPGDTVLRAGWSRAYQRNGMSDFTGLLDNNPGIITQDPDRTNGRGNLLAPGADFLLFRNGDLSPAPFDLVRNYPLTDDETQDVAWFDPDLQVPYADTWSAGWQRAVSRNMAVELRYVGTRSRDLWTNYNYNEVNIIENGVLGEFQLAQQNLIANVAAGRGETFAYFGQGTGTNPLPISLAYFSGLPQSFAGDPARYSSSNFRSSTFTDQLDPLAPNVFNFANNLDADAGRRTNALNGGLPSNFLVANPNKLGGATVQGNGGYTNFHSMQVELRRRMAQGLQFQMSYVWGRGYLSDFYSFRVPRLESIDSGSEGSVEHAVKANWVYELPFGQGRRFGSNVGPVMDRIIGGWQVHGIARFQSGEIVDFGNVRMVGFDKNDLKGFFGVRKDADGIVTYLPDDVIENTIRAFSTDPSSPTGYSALGAPEGRYFAPASGPDCLETIDPAYGSCGERVIEINSPLFKNVDLSIVKVVPIAGRVRAEFRMEMLNAFNWVNFNPAATVSDERDDYEINGLVGGPRVIQLVSRISW